MDAVEDRTVAVAELRTGKIEPLDDDSHRFSLA